MYVHESERAIIYQLERNWTFNVTHLFRSFIVVATTVTVSARTVKFKVKPLSAKNKNSLLCRGIQALQDRGRELLPFAGALPSARRHKT